jgi:hypothetical protein
MGRLHEAEARYLHVKHTQNFICWRRQYCIPIGLFRDLNALKPIISLIDSGGLPGGEKWTAICDHHIYR